MALSGQIDGEKQDANVLVNYRISYEVTDSDVVFTASVRGSANWANKNYGGGYIFLGNAKETMTLSVDGIAGAAAFCGIKRKYGEPASGQGWRTYSGPFEESTVTVPLRGGNYAVTISFVGNGGASDSHTVMIAVPSTLSLSGNREINSPQTISIERSSPDLLDTITYACGEEAGTVVSATGEASVSWTPPYSLLYQVLDSRSVPVLFTVYTYSGNEAIGSNTLAVNFTIPDNTETKPTVSISVSAENTGMPSKFSGLYIQGKSRVRTAFTAAGKYDAEIAQYASTVNSKTVTGNPSVSDPLAVSGESTVTGAATDSRGIRNSASATVTVQPYTPPAVIPYTGYANIVVARCNAQGQETIDGTNLLIRAGKRYSSINGINRCSLSFRWKARSSETYSQWVTILAASSGSDYVATVITDVVFQSTIIYDVQLRAQDDLEAGAPILFPLLTAEVPLHLADGGTAVGVGRFADPAYGKSLQVGWAARFFQNVDISGALRIGGETIFDVIYPVGSIYISANSTSPASLFGGTWEEIQGRFLLGRDSSHAAGSTGGEEAHTLTVDEMPEHDHEYEKITENGDTFGVFGGGGQGGWGLKIDGTNNNYGRFSIKEAGGGQAHNNMPPYLAVYMWKRTA